MVGVRRAIEAMVVLAALVIGVVGCATTETLVRPEATIRAPRITAVVALPPRLGYGQAADERRAARRFGDVLIEASGGHAILAEELTGTDPESLVRGVRALGEDPTGTLIFSITARRGERVEAVALPGTHGSGKHVRRYADYTVHVDVHRCAGADLVGSTETFASALANAPEVGADGRPQGLLFAMESAVKDALRKFAPDLVPAAPLPTLIEAPQRATGQVRPRPGSAASRDELTSMASLYPELSADDLASLTLSRARFLIVRPGRLVALGIARGDLVSGTRGRPLGSRAAFARALARGEIPAMSVDRAGGHFLVAQALASRAH